MPKQMNDLPLKLRPLLDDFVHALSYYRSKGEITPLVPATGKRLAEKWNMARPELRLTDIDIRSLVNAARCAGNPIASTPKGYFYALSAGELQATIEDMAGRESAIRHAREGLQKAYGA